AEQTTGRHFSTATWYRDGKRWGQQGLDHFKVTESGIYECYRPDSGPSPAVFVLDDPLVLQVPARALLEGDTVTLRCRGRQDNPGPGGLRNVSVSIRESDSDSARCQVRSEGGNVRKSSARLRVTVRMPVANATITPGPLAHQVHTGDNVTLRCSVQVGSAPVIFTWLHNGQEVARGPLLELGDIDVGHSGTYQCVATNQLGQDGHRVFRALSPELALEVTPGSAWLTDPLVLQVPARALLEGDTVTLRCRGRQDNPVTRVRFYQDMKDLGESLTGTELSLSPLQLNHSGFYHCRARVGSGMSVSASERVTVTVHGEHPTAGTPLFPVPGLEGPPEPTEGSPLTLSPLRPRAPLLHVFSRDGQVVGGPQGSPQLLLPAVGVSHSGHYSCQVRSEGGNVRKSSARLRVTVRSECGDGHGVSPEMPRIPCLGTPITAWRPPSVPGGPFPHRLPSRLSRPTHPSLKSHHFPLVPPSPLWVSVSFQVSTPPSPGIPSLKPHSILRVPFMPPISAPPLSPWGVPASP
ncbi:Fc receptor-like protein 3, partial [Passer montanus]|uniref:Fc receptor-like protein 3 n=1 Tax=Passer montanus TaxID=9160 RepID=UPI00196227B3